jgi:tocopherol cyclase
MSLKKCFNPELFQGKKKKDRYFEGWYFKIVSSDENYSLALIPGVSINKTDPHAFIQVFLMANTDQRPNLKTYYLRFDLNDFSYEETYFKITIADNVFSSSKVSLNINQEELSLNGVIEIKQLTPIRKTLIMPNIMGFFGYFSFMECYHGVISLTHQINGQFKINDETISFNSGKGYIEKDWGKSFPRSYVWLQTNHFLDQNASFMFSYADIPFLGTYFKGLICILWVDGKEYRFATYNFSRIKKEEIGENHVQYQIKKGRYVLNIYATKDDSIELASPKDGLMNQTIKEGLSGRVSVLLIKGKHKVFNATGVSAGIEIMK